MPQSRGQVVACIGLGGNQGDREACLEAARQALARTEGVTLEAASTAYETAPLTKASQGPYLNAVARVRTHLEPEALLRRLQEIETQLGRRRTGRWHDRPIDLDLLLYGDRVIERDELIVPHPEMHLRSFVLRGLCEVAPDRIHPRLGCSMRILAERLGGGDFVRDPNRPQLVAVAGCIGAGKTTLARALAEALEGEMVAEAYDTNPYLPQVCAGRRDLALDSQLYFLRSRVEQLNRDRLVPGGVYVSDYVFDKDRLFARRTLDGAQYAAYDTQAQALVDRVAEPVVVVFLRVAAEVCLERIHRRNRPYEQKLRLASLRTLIEQYEALFAAWRRCPVIRVHGDRFDGRRAEDRDWIVQQVRAYLCPVGKAKAVHGDCGNHQRGA